MEKQIKLRPEQQYMIDQVVASLRIENMEPSKEDITDFEAIITGQKTADQIAKEYLEEIKNE